MYVKIDGHAYSTLFLYHLHLYNKASLFKYVSTKIPEIPSGRHMSVLCISRLQTRETELFVGTENASSRGSGGAGLPKAHAAESWPSRALGGAAAGLCRRVADWAGCAFCRSWSAGGREKGPTAGVMRHSRWEVSQDIVSGERSQDRS